MTNRNTSFITLIHGNDISEDEAEQARKNIESKVGSNVDVTVINGGQPVYHFIVSVE